MIDSVCVRENNYYLAGDWEETRLFVISCHFDEIVQMNNVNWRRWLKKSRERNFVRHEAIMKSLLGLFSARAGKFIQRMVARQITLYKSTSASQRALVTTAGAPLECYRTLLCSAGTTFHFAKGRKVFQEVTH